MQSQTKKLEEYIVECNTAEECSIVASHIKGEDYDCLKVFRYIINSKILGKNKTLHDYIPNNCSHLPVLTFKQFQEKIMNTQKIIGYKAPYDLADGLVAKGTIYKLYKEDKRFYSPNGEYSPYVLPKEIVETWEAVYEDEIKVGDWVYFIKSFDDGSIGHIAKITSLEVEKSCQEKTYWLKYSPKCKYTGGFRVGGDGYFLNKDFRKATQEEIDSLFNKTLTLSNGKEVIIKKGKIIAGKREVYVKNLELLIPYIEGFNNWAVSLTDATYKIGCWENVKLADIKMIIEEANKQKALMD